MAVAIHSLRPLVCRASMTLRAPARANESTDDLKARVDAGNDLHSGLSGINWNASVYYEGLGSDNNTLGISLGLGIDY